MRTLFAALALIVCGFANAATCNITEFTAASPVVYQAALVPSLITNAVTYTTTSVQSPVFQPTTGLVRVTCDAVAYLRFGANPTATLTTLFLPAGVVEYFAITPATTPPYTALRLAVIGP